MKGYIQLTMPYGSPAEKAGTYPCSPSIVEKPKVGTIGHVHRDTSWFPLSFWSGKKTHSITNLIGFIEQPSIGKSDWVGNQTIYHVILYEVVSHLWEHHVIWSPKSPWCFWSNVNMCVCVCVNRSPCPCLDPSQTLNLRQAFLEISGQIYKRPQVKIYGHHGPPCHLPLWFQMYLYTS